MYVGTPLVALYLLTTIVTGAVAWWSIRQRHGPGAVPFGIVAAAVAVWALLSAMLQHPLLQGEVVYSLVVRLVWVPVGVIAVAWLAFGLTYTGRDAYLTRSRVVALSVLPAITVVVGLGHPILVSAYADALAPLGLGFVADWLAPLGPAWDVTSVIAWGYTYLLVGVGSLLLLEVVVEGPLAHPSQLLLGLVVAPPWVLNALQLFVLDLQAFNPTILGFAVSGVAGAFAVGRSKLLDVPLARARVVEELDDGVVVYGRDGRVYDYNDAAATLLGVSPEAVGTDVERVLADSSLAVEVPSGVRPFADTGVGAGGEGGAGATRGGTGNRTGGPDPAVDGGNGTLASHLDGQTIGVDGYERQYVEARVSDLTNAAGQPVSRILQLTDVTDRHRRMLELQSERDARKALQDALAEATSIEALATAACEQLAVLDPVVDAWIGTVDPTGRIHVLAETDRHDDHEVPVAPLETPVDGDGTGSRAHTDRRHPAETAIRDGRTHAVDLEAVDAAGAGRLADDVTTVLAVPVDHDGITRGVLTTYLRASSISDDRVVSEFAAEAAGVVGNELGSDERRRSLTADDRVAVRIALGPAEDSLTAAVPETVTARVSGVVPREDGTVLAYVRIPRRAAETFETGATDVPGLGSVEHLGTDDEARFEVVLPEPVPETVVAEHGGNVVEGTVSGDGRSVTATFPRGTNFEPVIEALESAFGRASVDQYESSPDNGGEPGEQLPLGSLTDRQREVLEAAYRAGYFAYPRDRSATEVAESLDVSRPAFQEVLQAAQRNAFADVFEDE